MMLNNNNALSNWITSQSSSGKEISVINDIVKEDESLLKRNTHKL